MSITQRRNRFGSFLTAAALLLIAVPAATQPTGRLAPALGLPQQHSGRVIIRAFAQGAAGNCTSIAAIKAAMLAFGPRPIFTSIRSDEGGDVVTMRDGSTEYRLSTAELSAAPALSRFVPTDSALTAYANYLFAAMTKRVQVESAAEGRQLTFAEAAEELNEGQHWIRGPYWLGLEQYVLHGPNSRVPYLANPRRFLRTQEAGIAKRYNHTWFTSFDLHDQRGEAKGPFRFISGAIALDIEKIRAEVLPAQLVRSSK